MSTSLLYQLSQRVDLIDTRIRSACQRAGRERNEITLIAVTKNTSDEVAVILPDLNIFNLGESRPQELWRKAPLFPASIVWHQIGHLQRNKVERTLPFAHLIHAVDSERILLAIEEHATKRGLSSDVLLEVNASREPNKFGFAPEQMGDLMPIVNRLESVRVRGLMTMAAFAEPEACRPTFRLLRELRDKLKDGLKSPHTLEHLSMGMSNDFEVAIEEGATFVRIGTVLFEGLSVR